MHLLIDYFKCGEVNEDSNGMRALIVRKFSDINTIIIPFFVKYALHSSIYADYLDYCKVANIMESKTHLTKEGLEEIDRIKSSMNKNRFRRLTK